MAGLTATWIPGTVIAAEAEIVALLTPVAVRVTVKSVSGGAVGALYVVVAPLLVATGETVPQGAVAQDTVQVTPPLAGSLTTVAEICVVVPAGTVELPLRATEIAIPPATVTLVSAATAGLLADFAVMVTVRSAGGRVAGAV